MIRVVAAFVLCLNAVQALTVSQPKAQKMLANMSLAEWLGTGECFNLALVPQYNNQHSIWGLLEFLRKQGHLKYLTGISACSGGTLPGAFIAAGKSFDDFAKVFPKNGWLGFGPSEPKITDDYKKFLSGLPTKFEDLKIPFAISATSWDSENSLKAFHKVESHEMVLSSGELYEPLLTAVATGNSGVIKDESCPKCKFGFYPRKIEGKYPVTDGAFTDIWGTKGLAKLPKCKRLLHVLPLDYPGQTAPQSPDEIAGQPEEVVTMVVTQPPVASHSYFHEGGQKKVPFKFAKGSEKWNSLMFEKAHEGISKVVSDKMTVEKIVPGISKHYIVLVDNAKELRKVEARWEKVYDAMMDTMRDGFWDLWAKQDGFGDKKAAAAALAIVENQTEPVRFLGEPTN